MTALMLDVFGPWIRDPGALAKPFATASPFPHVRIDGFLDPAFAEELYREFPAPDEMPKSRDYVFGDKHELSSVASRGPASLRYHDALLSPEFADALHAMTGRQLFIDPAHHGGGFHQGADGSFLDTHVDFNVHPIHADWLRALNLLLYLCKDWREEYDGALLIRTSPDAEPTRLLPEFNRAVIMLTGDNTYHGYRRMSLPPGVTRKLIAAYAYEHIEEGAVRPRTTGWAPETAGPVKRMIARYYTPLVRTKNRLFGSSTAKNR